MGPKFNEKGFSQFNMQMKVTEFHWVKMKINILFVTPGENFRGQRFCNVLFHDWVMARSTGSPTTSSSPSRETHRGSRGLMGSVVPVACH